MAFKLPAGRASTDAAEWARPTGRELKPAINAPFCESVRSGIGTRLGHCAISALGPECVPPVLKHERGARRWRPARPAREGWRPRPESQSLARVYRRLGERRAWKEFRRRGRLGRRPAALRAGGR